MAGVSRDWSVTVEFTTEDPEAAEALRDAIAAVAERFRGIENPMVSGEHPDYMAWYQPLSGPARLLDLRTDR